MWKKVVESRDIIVFEKNLKDCKLRIEARKADGQGWEVFKTKVTKDSSNLISEFSMDTKIQARQIIKKLKNERVAASSTSRNSPSALKVSLKRAYKEDLVEKWYFHLSDSRIKNFIIVRFDTTITVDVVMHEKYRYYERAILQQLEDKLGLKELGDTIKHEIYYFRKWGNSYQSNRNILEDPQGFVDIEFGFSDEDDS